MIDIKTPEQIAIMKEGGVILSEVMEVLLAAARPGVSLLELDELAEKEIIARGATPSFKRVPGYKWTLCTCVNDVVVHGIPTKDKIEMGDVVGIDCGVYYRGYHTDSAWTVRMGPDGSKTGAPDAVDEFLEVGKTALQRGIDQALPGNHIFDISQAVQQTVEGAGYSVVRTLVGHGVGKELHEDPEVPNYVNKKRKNTPQLKAGMTIAIEVIYVMGDPDVVYQGKDGWTIVTKDGTLSALFEATVALNTHGLLVLTKLYGASGNG